MSLALMTIYNLRLSLNKGHRRWFDAVEEVKTHWRAVIILGGSEHHIANAPVHSLPNLTTIWGEYNEAAPLARCWPY